jgi:hypothetical protein
LNHNPEGETRISKHETRNNVELQNVQNMKKKCQEINELLVDYADGELSGDIAAEVAEHLAQCPACQAKVKALTRSLAAAQAIWQDTEKTVSGTVSFPSACALGSCVKKAKSSGHN